MKTKETVYRVAQKVPAAGKKKSVGLVVVVENLSKGQKISMLSRYALLFFIKQSTSLGAQTNNNGRNIS